MYHHNSLRVSLYKISSFLYTFCPANEYTYIEGTPMFHKFVTREKENTIMADDNKDLGTQGQEDTLKGKMDQAAGKVQQKVGQATGNTEMETKGNAKQVGGTAKSTLGNAEQKVDSALDPDKK